MAANGRHSFQHSKTQVLVLELIFVKRKRSRSFDIRRYLFDYFPIIVNQLINMLYLA